MRVISYESSRVTLLFPLEEFAPPAGADGPAISEAVTKRYSFRRPPNLAVPKEEIEKNGVKFESGKFEFEGKEVAVQLLAVYSDGLNIDANTTDRADAFLDDLLVFLRTEFKFREFSSRPRKFFGSQIIAEFETPLSGLLGSYDKLLSAMKEGTANIYETEVPSFGFSRLDFQMDPTDGQSPRPPPRVIIERRAGTLVWTGTILLRRSHAN